MKQVMLFALVVAAVTMYVTADNCDALDLCVLDRVTGQEACKRDCPNNDAFCVVGAEVGCPDLLVKVCVCASDLDHH
ncbi:hypothetical protein AAVH_17183 [Aphelenchoides avenae]|nr:hypothetical protein AAVH_17183 [Aphelenchus avenae]